MLNSRAPRRPAGAGATPRRRRGPGRGRGPGAGPPAAWRAEDGAALYNLGAWGDGYYGVDRAGRAVVRPRGPGGGEELVLREVVDELRAREGLVSPFRGLTLFRYNVRR